jgi:hypothetical protein
MEGTDRGGGALAHDRAGDLVVEADLEVAQAGAVPIARLGVH